MIPQKKPLRVMFCCSGVGILNRGVESFFRTSFDGLKDAMPGIECRLLKGAGFSNDREKRVWCLSRTGLLASLLGRMIKRNPYVAEQLSAFPAVALEIRKWKPDVVFYSDNNLGFQLFRWRSLIGVPYKLLLSNGGPCSAPFDRHDFIQQLAPLYLQEAILAGESGKRHFMVPLGINMIQPPVCNLQLRSIIRKKLGIPVDRRVVLSVGWIERHHKRMDYVVEEVARMAEPRPFLQLLGAIDENSEEIIGLAEKLLGCGNYSIKSVPYEEVADYYKASDCFVLGSIKEAFGLVYIEALMHGLPVVAHDHSVIKYVVGDLGIFGDLSKEGSLAGMLLEALKISNSESMMRRRWESVRDRFSWPVLALKYAEMFRDVASHKA